MRVLPAVGVIAFALLLSGCSLLGFGGDDGSAPAPKSTSQKPVAQVDQVLKALEPLTGSNDSIPSSKKFFDTMIAAGYEPKQLEATIDASPLGNEVPSKMFGVRTKAGCVVGEIRKGKAEATLMPETKSTGACLIGEVDRPKGVKAPKGENRSDDEKDNGKGHIPGEAINGPGDAGATPAGTPTNDGEGFSGTSSDSDSSGEAPSLGGG